MQSHRKKTAFSYACVWSAAFFLPARMSVCLSICLSACGSQYAVKIRTCFESAEDWINSRVLQCMHMTSLRQTFDAAGSASIDIIIIIISSSSATDTRCDLSYHSVVSLFLSSTLTADARR